jgi:hypothetical protein
MGQTTDSQQIKLPDRKAITLCEAVTAFVFGKASDALEYLLDSEPETEEQRAKAKDLIKQLRSAAYAGHVRFRALKNGDNPADGYKDIDHLYFSEPRRLRWENDEIWSRGRDWRDVHLDRQGFEALLRKMDVSVQQSSDADIPGDQKIYTTGLAGRPTSIHLVLPMARDRLDAGDYADTQKTFSEQLAADLAKTEPAAPRMSPKAIRNNPEFRELWRRRKLPKIIDPS